VALPRPVVGSRGSSNNGVNKSEHFQHGCFNKLNKFRNKWLLARSLTFILLLTTAPWIKVTKDGFTDLG
jgi:hypothetical protein